MISIVIPHFNDCSRVINLLGTIPDNAYIEVIVVDDASDNLTLLQKYLNGHRKNVELFVNDCNLGAGACRNIGLSKCNNEWVLFADSDDYFTADAFDIIPNDIKTKSFGVDKFLSW